MKQIIYLVARYLQYIAAAGLLVLMLLQVANMSGRLFFGSPIKGTTDLGSYMLLVIAALGFGWAALESRHIKVTLVTDRLPAKVQYYLELVILSIIFVVVVYLTYVHAWAAFTWPPRSSSVLNIPFTPFRFILAGGFGVLSVCTLVVVVEHLLKRNKNSHES